MKKLSVIGGAGGIGSTIGFYVGHCGLFEEIALVDIKRDLLLSHACDMEQSVGEFNATKFSAGSWEELAGSDVVLMGASAPQPKAGSRNEFLQINLGIVKAAAEAIKKYCPEAIVVTATCPTDVFNYVFHQMLGGDKRRFIGFTRNDSVRLRWACAKVLGVEAHRVGGMVIGEHGETQVPLYGSVTVDGKPANLSAAQIAQVDSTLKNFFLEQMKLDANRSSTWLTPTSITFILRALCQKGSPKDLGPIPASAILEGEYGLSGVSLGMPLIIGPNGWREIQTLKLTDKEQAALEASAKQVKGLIAACG